MENKEKNTDSPGIKIPPPLVLLLTFGIFMGTEALKPAPIPFDISQWWGLFLLIIGLVLSLSAVMKFLVSGNHLHPNKPSNTFITSGAYTFTRNPMYLGAFVSFLGAALLIQSLWIIIAALVILIYFQRLIIPCEEAYMERKYGKDYEEYCDKVSRWL